MFYGEGYANPLQYSYMENPKNRGAWSMTVHGIAKFQTRLKRLSTRIYILTVSYTHAILIDSFITMASPLTTILPQ